MSAAGDVLIVGELDAATGASADVQAAVKRTSQATMETGRYRERRSRDVRIVRNRTRYYGSVAAMIRSSMMPRSTGTAPVDDTAAWRQDPDHETSLLFDVFVLGQRTRALVAEAMRDAEMRPDEYAAYSVVFEAGPLTQTDLAERLGMAVTTVADYVRTMVERATPPETATSHRSARRVAVADAGRDPGASPRVPLVRGGGPRDERSARRRSTRVRRARCCSGSRRAPSARSTSIPAQRTG